ncbi:Aste57867_24107 [Aphanomyces stellatus]|uniref:Aste57867_24107 protein n=1 Tax=Aphanomyces stellatus TaxID=120398 RepID=A0A485LQM4_9STRA|nr:hypothetical protein As57867_024034 [Aphanomyces stellatus]VFU00749.1 Aste57867_24107 [Aphanomyces stellatus]
MQRTLRQSRQSGNLNLSAKELTDVPEAVFFPNKHMDSDEKHWECRDLVKLDLSYNDLVAIPPAIEQLKALTWLKIKQNQIAEVPPQLGTLHALVYLDLSNNKLHGAPACLGQLVQLRELALSGNALTTLPDDMGRLSRLEVLALEHNHLARLPPSLGALKLLRRLTVQHNTLDDDGLPDSLFASLVHLDTLDLSHNTLSTVPPLDTLAHLKLLDLRHNRLVTFPSLPKAATASSVLDQVLLGHNRLTVLPADQLARVQTSLSVLDVRGNKIAHLPAQVASLSKLKSLDLTNNDLTDLPSGLGSLASLNHLLVDGNPLRAIRQAVLAGGCVALKKYLQTRQPPRPTTATSTSLAAASPSTTSPATTSSSTKSSTTPPTTNASAPPGIATARAFPDHILRDAISSGVLDMTNHRTLELSISLPCVRLGSALLHLNISQNGLDRLPHGLEALVSLQTLTAEDNRLTHLPLAVAHLPRLQALRLKRNRLSDATLAEIIAPDATIRCTLQAHCNYRELDVRHNALTAAPPALAAFQALDTLLLSFNKLTSLNGVDWAAMTKLTSCLVSDNQLESIGTIHLAPSLTSLNVENNNLRHIPLALGQSPNLRLVNVQGNPQRHIRYTIVQRGPQAVLQYLRDQHEQPTTTVTLHPSVPIIPLQSAAATPPPAFPPSSATAIISSGTKRPHGTTMPDTTARLAKKPTPSSSETLTELDAKIRAAEAQYERGGLSTAAEWALKKQLAQWRKQRHDR